MSETLLGSSPVPWFVSRSLKNPGPTLFFAVAMVAVGDVPSVDEDGYRQTRKDEDVKSLDG